MNADNLFMSEAQFAAELERCEYCEEKPCTKACPADCSPADFIMAARGRSKGDIQRAAGLIMTKNPLGGICGTICPDTHCQAACSRKGFDGPLEIPLLQSAIIARAKKMGLMPELEAAPANGRKVAVVGAGPAGLAAALTLMQLGYQVEVFERSKRAGGACALIPPARLDPQVLQSDVDWLTRGERVNIHYESPIEDPASLLEKGYEAVLLAIGLYQPISLGIPGEQLALAGNDYLVAPDQLTKPGRVAVIGGGAIACDCALSAKKAGSQVEMFALETVAEMPLTTHELKLLLEHNIHMVGRTRVKEIIEDNGAVSGVLTQRVDLPSGVDFHPAKVVDVAGTEQSLSGFSQVIIAIGNRPELKPVAGNPADGGPADGSPALFSVGDGCHGPSTAVEAVASGKNGALAVHAHLNKQPLPTFDQPLKSHVRVAGYNDVPVNLETDFFGRKLISPFLLSAAPPTDGYDQMKQAFDAGWAGGIMKTAFDGLPIHIPADYMHVFDGETYGNCDNVSDHVLDRVCGELKKLVREYPDRLSAASTGGPVTGDDDNDRKGWQSNTKKLEAAGAMAIEYSLSCPQGGDGTEGDIVSQSPGLTAKIIDWVLQTGDPEIPKLFKLTGAVTSVAVIVKAIQEVLQKHPGKKAGVTLANTFPTLFFRPGPKKEWDEGVLVGMSGTGVTPISNLTLASVSHLGVTVSGNGGPMDYRAAAHFLALGARSVQFCTVAMKYGVNIVDELHSGLSHMMLQRGIGSVEALIGAALPNPITDFMDLTATKRVPSVEAGLCMSCGNCTRCSYHAVSLNSDNHPVFDASKCIGCSLCSQKCFSGALQMVARES